MIDLDDEVAKEYLAECREHLAAAEADLSAISDTRAGMSEELAARLLRAVRVVRGADLFGLARIREVGLAMEEAVGLFRFHKLILTRHRTRVLLRATGMLHDLVEHPATSNLIDATKVKESLANLCEDYRDIPREMGRSRTAPMAGAGKRLRALLVEDDGVSRLAMRTFLSRYGACDAFADGKEGVEAFRAAVEPGPRYDLVCMDIMMPEMDGREALRQMRAIEEAHGIQPANGAKIVMTTALGEIREVIRCFRELCDGYLLKPVDLGRLFQQMKLFGLVDEGAAPLQCAAAAPEFAA